MAAPKGRYLLIALVVLTAASVWRAVSVEREKRRLTGVYQEAKREIEQLSGERAHLNHELVDSRQTVESQAGEMANLQQELSSVQDQLEKTLTQIAALHREHDQLRQENTSLTTQLSSLAEEKTELERRLSSVKELKLAIREVRRKIWGQRFAAWRARSETRRRADREQLASGNRGYLVRDGKPTMGAATRLQVHVLEPQAQ